MRLSSLTGIACAVVLASCTGSPGPQGPEGPAGAPSQEYFRTKWAATEPGTYESGEIGAPWTPASRKVTIYKTSDVTRLKINVSDNFRTGHTANGGGDGWYSVRMNGSGVGCDATQYQWNSVGWANNYHLPFANLCVTDVLPKGLYEFEVWARSVNGSAYVGWGTNGHAVLLVEEFDATALYALSTDGDGFGTVSTTFVKAPGREVTYDKASSSTILKITLADTLRIGYNQNGGSGTVMIRMDGADTTCRSVKYDAQDAGGDHHNPFVMTCVLANVAAGARTFDVWIRSDTAGEMLLGRNRSNPTLLVEELPATGVTYVNGSSESGEISGGWAAVGTRQVTHTVTAAGKTLKLTYSDTFRAVRGNCNGRAGFFQLYVDNEPTGCMNGQHVSNGGTHQDHHHPANQICLVSDLTPGSHTFAIWSTSIDVNGTSCGSNFFGHIRGQNLLMAEELP